MAEEKDDKPKHSAAFLEKYRSRISILKVSHDYYQKDNIAKAVEGFCQYLNIVAQFMSTTEEKLKPSLFDKKKDVAEMLLISQVYWGLAKAYDRNPKLQNECRRCLDQFCKFSIGFKHQYINSEMIRKFIKKNIAYNPKLFQMAYKRIQVDSKQCYVATYCLGEDDYYTNLLRDFRQVLLKSKMGERFVFNYYRYSPPFVNFCQEHPVIGKALKIVIKPSLIYFAKFARKFII